MLPDVAIDVWRVQLVDAGVCDRCVYVYVSERERVQVTGDTLSAQDGAFIQVW